MSFEIRSYVASDLRAFADTAAEMTLRPYLEALNFDAYEAAGPGWTGYWNGSPVAAGGFIEPYGPDNKMRAAAWAIMVASGGPWFIHVHRAVKRAIEASPYLRIEAHVYCGFSAAHRWMELLGFTLETERKANWAPDGHAVAEYVILRDTDYDRH